MDRQRRRQYQRVGTVHGPRKPGKRTVTATSSGLSGTATLNVTAAQGVLVSPSALAIAAGATQTFAATVNGAAVAATWEVNGTPEATDSTGRLIPAEITSRQPRLRQEDRPRSLPSLAADLPPFPGQRP